MFCTCKDSEWTINRFNTCWVIANPMTGSPSRISHVTIAEFPSSGVMVTLSGADKLSEKREETDVYMTYKDSPTVKHKTSMFIVNEQHSAAQNSSSAIAVQLLWSFDRLLYGSYDVLLGWLLNN